MPVAESIPSRLSSFLMPSATNLAFIPFFPSITLNSYTNLVRNGAYLFRTALMRGSFLSVTGLNTLYFSMLASSLSSASTIWLYSFDPTGMSFILIFFASPMIASTSSPTSGCSTSSLLSLSKYNMLHWIEAFWGYALSVLHVVKYNHRSSWLSLFRSLSSLGSLMSVMSSSV